MPRHLGPAALAGLRSHRLHGALLGAICLTAWSASAAAQQAPAAAASTPPTPAATAAKKPAGEPKKPVQQLEGVQVTGIRSSIQSSIDAKRDDTVISDVLSSKDIGGLPALSIGEALETVTGASTHRDKGQATEISIRGLGPFLGSATFNGREATNGSGDRSVNFSLFPAELINTVAVYKTQRADLVEGGTSGTINLGTVQPLDYGKRLLQVEGLATYADYDRKLKHPDGIGGRETLSYLDQFDLGDAGKLGVSFGYQALQGTDPEEVFSSSSTWAACDNTQVVPRGSNCRTVNAKQVQAGTPYYLIPGSRTYRQIVEHDQRHATFAALQWKPSDSLQVGLDYQGSRRTYSEDRSDLVLSEGMRGINNRVVNDDGALLSYTGNSTLESTPDYKVRDEQYKGGGLNVEWRPDDAWTLVGDLSYSHTERVETDRTVRLRSNATDIDGNPVPGIDGQRVDYAYDYSGDVPGITFNPAYDLDRYENFSAAARARRDEEEHKNQIRAGRFDATYTTTDGFFTDVKAGVRFSQNTYSDYDDRVEINVTDPATIRNANLACRKPFPQDGFLAAADGNTVDHWATFDSRCLFQAVTGVYDTGRNPDLRNTANNDVTERTRAAYLMGEFATDLFGLPVTGNIGARYVQTRVKSVGLRGDLQVIDNPDGTIQLVDTGNFDRDVIHAKNNVFLPSLNANFALNDQTQLRFGLYRAMTRPDLDDLGAGRTLTLQDGTEFATVRDAINNITATGNPRQKPLLSWNGDLSLEWYPNPDSILSGAVYVKRFTGGSIPTVIDETFNIDGNNVVVPVVQQVTSNQKSLLRGFELTAAHRFSYLPAPFDGLGAKLSYNYAHSNFQNQDLRLGDQIDPATGVVTPGIVAPADIFGLSKNVASGQLYYDKGPIELQAIYKYRSEYYQQFTGDPAQNRYIQGGHTVDARATYNVDDHLSFSLEGTNLTNEPRISYMPISHASYHEYHVYGRRYYLGVKYRF